ncbi:MAG: PAC2 family protein [Candidatus Bathyarchaeota archaeon]
MSVEKIGEMNIIETTKIDAKNPSIVIGIPDVGLVGSISVSHMVTSLNLAEVGYIESDLLPPVMIVHKNEVKSPVRIFCKGEIIAILSEVILSRGAVTIIAKVISKWAKKHNTNSVIGVTGLAVPNRHEIEKPTVYGVGTVADSNRRLKEAHIAPLEEGMIAGPLALIVKECMRKEQANITLIVEAHSEFPDPGAAASTIESLNALLGTNMNVEKLMEGAEEIRIKMRDLMRQTSDQMRQMKRVQEQQPAGIVV